MSASCEGRHAGIWYQNLNWTVVRLPYMMVAKSCRKWPSMETFELVSYLKFSNSHLMYQCNLCIHVIDRLLISVIADDNVLGERC